MCNVRLVPVSSGMPVTPHSTASAAVRVLVVFLSRGCLNGLHCRPIYTCASRAYDVYVLAYIRYTWTHANMYRHASRGRIPVSQVFCRDELSREPRFQKEYAGANGQLTWGVKLPCPVFLSNEHTKCCKRWNPQVGPAGLRADSWFLPFRHLYFVSGARTSVSETCRRQDCPKNHTDIRSKTRRRGLLLCRHLPMLPLSCVLAFPNRFERCTLRTGPTGWLQRAVTAAITPNVLR